MAVIKVLTEEFLQLAKYYPVLDVRSPGEYSHAHIPGAISFPLFSDEERKVVGTMYKQESKEKAIKKGLEYFGVKMVKMVEEAENISNKISPDKQQPEKKIILVHCWRGGMRSAAVAWLLDVYGFNVYLLTGGYKAFRHWVLARFESQYNFKIIGGNTGSGKTDLLKEMDKNGLAIIDLEGLANHKGSAFGAINMPEQPSQEMFENKLAFALNEKQPAISIATGKEQSNVIYLEDESQRIGLVNIPVGIWKQMRIKPILFLHIPFEERLNYIVADYGKGDKEKLVNAVIRIKKRLGGLETKAAINFLIEDNLLEAFRILLFYYDKMYKKGLQKRENWQQLCTEIVCEKVDARVNTQKIILQETKQIHV